MKKDAEDKRAIRELIENWAVWRDALMWDRFATVWHADGQMWATWFQGSYTDFIGIVSGRSDRQVDAIAESVSQVLKARGLYPLGQEGTGSGRWTLLDFGAFVIHIFYHPVREFYDLESLWIEAPRVKLDVPPEATLQQPDALYGVL